MSIKISAVVLLLLSIFSGSLARKCQSCNTQQGDCNTGECEGAWCTASILENKAANTRTIHKDCASSNPTGLQEEGCVKDPLPDGSESLRCGCTNGDNCNSESGIARLIGMMSNQFSANGNSNTNTNNNNNVNNNNNNNNGGSTTGGSASGALPTDGNNGNANINNNGNVDAGSNGQPNTGINGATPNSFNGNGNSNGNSNGFQGSGSSSPNSNPNQNTNNNNINNNNQFQPPAIGVNAANPNSSFGEVLLGQPTPISVSGFTLQPDQQPNGGNGAPFPPQGFNPLGPQTGTNVGTNTNTNPNTNTNSNSNTNINTNPNTNPNINTNNNNQIPPQNGPGDSVGNPNGNNFNTNNNNNNNINNNNQFTNQQSNNGGQQFPTSTIGTGGQQPTGFSTNQGLPGGNTVVDVRTSDINGTSGVSSSNNDQNGVSGNTVGTSSRTAVSSGSGKLRKCACTEPACSGPCMAEVCYKMTFSAGDVRTQAFASKQGEIVQSGCSGDSSILSSGVAHLSRPVTDYRFKMNGQEVVVPARGYYCNDEDLCNGGSILTPLRMLLLAVCLLCSSFLALF